MIPSLKVSEIKEILTKALNTFNGFPQDVDIYLHGLVPPGSTNTLCILGGKQNGYIDLDHCKIVVDSHNPSL